MLIPSTYPKTHAFIEELEKNNFHTILDQINDLASEFGDEYFTLTERLLSFSDRIGGTPLNSIIEYTVHYLREQVSYLATGQYSNVDFNEVFVSVYDNEEIIKAFYLEGLMLTHGFWKIHFLVHKYFMDQFIPQITAGACGSEFGYGHGLYLLEILSAYPDVSTKSFDISRYSREFAQKLLSTASIDPVRFDLQIADMRQQFPLDDESIEWAIFAEILEHIPDPAYALSEIARCTKDGAPIFITTVVDSNALDHIYMFENPSEVRNLIENADITITSEMILKVAELFPGSKDKTIDLAYICQRNNR
ncbi:MAG: methyltransferase domain-containing protein [Deltaproteobacteria bacterium]|jgi:ubiquinone/menaquinone biosynthesis C-methylase UbiE|nr:methyltransferase domain-containing protein [Deltaproteobacteria bacterium]